MSQALGLIEMKGLVGVTEAADAAVKAASVSIGPVEKIEGGLVSIRVLGDVAAVQAAVDAGAQAGGQVGSLFRSTSSRIPITTSSKFSTSGTTQWTAAIWRPCRSLN